LIRRRRAGWPVSRPQQPVQDHVRQALGHGPFQGLARVPGLLS
jgi:hypothetical protein